MYSFKVLSVIALCVVSANAVGYGAGAGPGSYAAAAAARGVYNTGAYVPGQAYPPHPYNFDYQARDEQGNVHYRQEAGDTSGAVRGTYGYTDNQGLYRVVEYVADAGGFRANVRSNEPGVGKESPADVVLTAADPPAGIQDRYTRVGTGYRAGAGSYAAGVVTAAGLRGAGFPHAAGASAFHGGKAY